MVNHIQPFQGCACEKLENIFYFFEFFYSKLELGSTYHQAPAWCEMFFIFSHHSGRVVVRKSSEIISPTFAAPSLV